MPVIVFITLFIAIISIVGWWVFFVNLGYKGYKGIIPFYNSYLLFDGIWDKKYFIPHLLSSLIIFSYAWTKRTPLLTVLLVFACIVYAFFDFMLSLKISLAFAGGYIIGLLIFLFKPIMFFIIGMSYSTFEDPKGKINNHRSLTREIKTEAEERKKKQL